MIRVGLAALVVAWCCLSWSGAAAAPPQVIAGTSGSCNHEMKSWGATLSESRDQFLLRYTASDGPTRLLASGQQTRWVEGPDVAWFRAHEEISDGGVLSGSVNCGEVDVEEFSVELFDIPAAPTTFSGRLTRQFVGSNEISFQSLGHAEHVVDVTVAQGALEVAADSQMIEFETVASTQRLPLGLLMKGTYSLYLNAADGPQAIWSLDVRALPVALTNLRWSNAKIEQGEVTELGYRSSGETDLTATILDSQGEEVRVSARATRIKAGERSLTWDGRRANGSDVSDGRYEIVLSTADPSGERGVASSSILVNRPPKTWIKKKPSRLVRTSKRRAKIKFILKSNEPNATFECRATKGWMPCRPQQTFRLRPGRYSFSARARDEFRAADKSPSTWRFRVKRKR